MSQEEIFWLYNPSVLVASPVMFPSRGMNNNQLLNVISRMIIIIAIVLFFVGYGMWWLFLGLGLLMTVVICYFQKPSDLPVHVEYYQRTKKPSTNKSGDRIRKLVARY